MKTSRLSRGQIFFCFLLFIPCLLTGQKLDNDIWFLLNSGRYVVQNGVPHIEPFTIHEGMSFVMQQWLSAVTFWKIYVFWGGTGLILLVIVFYIVFVSLTMKLSLMLSEGNFEISFIVTLLVSVTINAYMVERPHIFLFVIILSEIYFLEKYICTNKIMLLISLPIISILLVNLESAMWPFLFVILIPYFIDSLKFRFKFIESQGYGIKWIGIASIAMLIAGLINPYGVDAMTYLFNSYGIAEINSLINEMKCTDINNALGKIIFGIIFLSFFLICIYKKGNHRLRFHLLFLGTAYLAFSSLRSFSLFIICGIIPLSYYFRNFRPNIEYKNDKKTILIRWILIAIIIVDVGCLFIINNKNDKKTLQPELISNVDYLEKIASKDIKLYTGYNDGGYLEFRGYKVYMDPRAEVFLKNNNEKKDIFKEYYKLQNAELHYGDILDKYSFDYLLVGGGDILYHYLDHDDNYELIHSSSNYKIFKLKE